MLKEIIARRFPGSLVIQFRDYQNLTGISKIDQDHMFRQVESILFINSDKLTEEINKESDSLRIMVMGNGISDNFHTGRVEIACFQMIIIQPSDDYLYGVFFGTATGTVFTKRASEEKTAEFVEVKKLPLKIVGIANVLLNKLAEAGIALR